VTRPVLLYDGDCGFCTSSARFAEHRIPVSADVTPYQFADVEALGTTAGRARREVLWVENGRVYGGAQAVAMLLVRAGGRWRALGLALRTPPVRWIAAGVYRLVSANRHRLPGGTPACRVSPPDTTGMP
jgi:predicted DCC family thiol-disulfide oxidoreductase YuxK